MPSPSPASKLSHRAQNRLPSAIRSLYPAEKIPGMISLLSGKPNASTFPVRKITLDLETPSVDGPAAISSVTISGNDLETALQYGPTDGIPRLVQWIESLQTRIHGVQRTGAQWRCSVGVGSQDSLTKVSKLRYSPAFSQRNHLMSSYSEGNGGCLERR